MLSTTVSNLSKTYVMYRPATRNEYIVGYADYMDLTVHTCICNYALPLHLQLYKKMYYCWLVTRFLKRCKRSMHFKKKGILWLFLALR